MTESNLSFLEGFRAGSAAAGWIATSLAAAPLMDKTAPAVQAQTPRHLEFRWENSKDYRKLYYFRAARFHATS